MDDNNNNYCITRRIFIVLSPTTNPYARVHSGHLSESVYTQQREESPLYPSMKKRANEASGPTASGPSVSLSRRTSTNGPADMNTWVIRCPSTGDAHTSNAVPADTSVTSAKRRQSRSVERPSTPVAAATVDGGSGGGASIAGSLSYAIPNHHQHYRSLHWKLLPQHNVIKMFKILS